MEMDGDSVPKLKDNQKRFNVINVGVKSCNFNIVKLTEEEIKYLIQTDLLLSKEPKETYIIDVLKKLAKPIANIINLHLNKKAISQEVSNLLKIYKQNLEIHREHLIHIHLSTLILFNKLENDSNAKGDAELQSILSTIGNEIIKISEETNDKY